MFPRVAVLALTIVLVGCAGGPAAPVGFINHTRHSDADLWAIWKTAQQSVADEIDLNPLQRVNSSVLPRVLPGDSRALTVEPRQLLIAAAPDVSSAILFAQTGIERANPTGMIACPQPCNVRFSTAYSFYQPPLTRYAASWEFSGNNFSEILQYELENHILDTLGYDMTWR